MTKRILKSTTKPQICQCTPWHYTKTETLHWRAEALTLGTVFLSASSTKPLTGCVCA